MIQHHHNTILYITRSQDPTYRYIEYWFDKSPHQKQLLNQFNTIISSIKFYKEDSKPIKLPLPLINKFAKVVRELEPQSEWIKEYDYLQSAEGKREMEKVMECSKMLKEVLKDSSKILPDILEYYNPNYHGIIGEGDQRKQYLPISKKIVLDEFKRFAEWDLQRTAHIVRIVHNLNMKSKFDLQDWYEQFYHNLLTRRESLMEMK